MELGFERGRRGTSSTTAVAISLSCASSPSCWPTRSAGRRSRRGGRSRRTGPTPAARVAALIRDLDQIAKPQMIHFGNSADRFSPGAGAGRGGRSGRRTAAGRDRDRHAIDPHRDLRARDVDRSPRPSRLRARVRRPDGHPQDAAVLGQQSKSSPARRSRKDLARSMRDFWIRNRASPLTERWYRMLRDDSSGPRPLVGGGRRHRPAERRAGPVGVSRPPSRVVEPRAADKGEELRSRRDPSVSELLARRDAPDRPRPGRGRSPTSSSNEPASWRSCSTAGIRKPRCP